MTSGLKVEAIYKTVLGTITQPVMVLPGGGAWAPTLPLPFLRTRRACCPSTV